MKKIYTLALGLAVAMTANAQVVNTTTNESYDNFTTAFNAMTDGQTLKVTESCDGDNRYLVNGKTVTIEGASRDVVLTHTYNNSFFMGVQANGNLTVKNITLSSTKTRNTFFEISNGNNVFEFSNVTFTGFNCANGDQMSLFDLKTNGSNQTLKLTDCKFENSNFAYDITLPESGRCKFIISGDIKARFNMPNGRLITVEGELTNTDPIILNYTGEGGQTIVKNCTDVTKFELVDKSMKLQAKDGDIIVTMPDPVYVTTEPAAEGVNGMDFSSINAAVTAITNYNADEANAENKIEAATLTISKEQTITTRQTFPGNVALSFVPAEGQDITINCTANNISLLVNNSANLTISDITLASTGTNYNKQQMEVTSHGKLTLNNVTIKNMRNDNGVLLQVTNGGVVAANNVTVEDCYVAQHFAFYGVSGSSFSGATAYSFCVENNYNFNCVDWTPAEVVDVYFTGTRNFDTTLLNDFTDVAKLNLMTEGFALEAKDGKIMVVDPENTGIDNVAADDVNAPVEYFNLQGVRVDNPTSGFYVKKQGNKVSKVVF
ncbi:MAG: hypothetical protein K2M68_02065 [Muribaculaceae bacterium]|nr:hypothetical protein [Bacteroides sp.]MDE7472349.1 hypothetical protein [Muribaculaceae bacterium]